MNTQQIKETLESENKILLDEIKSLTKKMKENKKQITYNNTILLKINKKLLREPKSDENINHYTKLTEERGNSSHS